MNAHGLLRVNYSGGSTTAVLGMDSILGHVEYFSPFLEKEGHGRGATARQLTCYIRLSVVPVVIIYD